MNVYTLLLLFSASAVYASFSSSARTDSERSSGSLEYFKDFVSDASFSPQIRNDLVNRFNHGLLLRLISDEDQTFLNHLKYLADNGKRLAISKESYKTQIMNALSALVSSYTLQVRRQQQDLIPLRAEIEKIKKRILRIRKRGLGALEEAYENKRKAMEKKQMKLLKMEAFTNYCRMVGEDHCFKVVPINSPIVVDEIVKIE